MSKKKNKKTKKADGYDIAKLFDQVTSQSNADEDDNKSKHSASSKKLSSQELVNLFLEKHDTICSNNQIYLYDGERYIPASKELVITKMNSAVQNSDRNKLTYRDYSDAASLLMCMEQIQRNNLVADEGIILFENGIFDLTKEKFISPSPHRIIFTKIRASYWPNKKYATPVFDIFIEQITGRNKQIKRLLMAFLGYCLLPENKAKCFFVLGTAKNSGKSILAHLLEHLLGDENVSHVAIHDFGGIFNLTPLRNKALNTAMDLDSDIISKKAVSQIKNLTGDDYIEMNIKFQSPQCFKNRAKLVFATNHPIILDQADPAFWDRLIYIPFLHSTPKEDQDKQLLEKLLDEKDGIVKKAVKAAKKLISNNYVFPACDIAEYTLQTWRFGKDYSVSAFIRKCCVLTEDNSVKTHTSELYNSYTSFCYEENFDRVTINQFSRILTDMFKLDQHRWSANGSTSLRGFTGITLKNANTKY